MLRTLIVPTLIWCALVAPSSFAQDAAFGEALRAAIAERYPAEIPVRTLDVVAIDTSPLGGIDRDSGFTWTRVHYDFEAGRFATESRTFLPEQPDRFLEPDRFVYTGDLVWIGNWTWGEAYDDPEDVAAAERQFAFFRDLVRLGASIGEAEYLGERGYGDVVRGYAFAFAEGEVTLLFDADGVWIATVVPSFDADLREVPLLSVQQIEVVGGVPLTSEGRSYRIVDGELEPSGGYRRIGVRIDTPADALFAVPESSFGFR